MIDAFCKICGETGGEKVLDVTGYNDSYLELLKLEYEEIERFYIRCFKCGLVYKNLFLSDNEKDELYRKFRDDAFRSESKRQYFDRITSLPNEKSENFEKYEFLDNFLDSSGKHLDVGGGVGVFSFGFKNFFTNWSSVVVEPSQGVKEIAISNNVELINSYLSDETANIIGNNFDLITAIHVLEHVDSPDKFLLTLAKFLAENGMIYIETPSTLDIGFLDPSHDRFMSQHEVIYDEQSIVNLCKKTNLNVVFSETFISRRNRNNLRVLVSHKKQ